MAEIPPRAPRTAPRARLGAGLRSRSTTGSPPPSGGRPPFRSPGRSSSCRPPPRPTRAATRGSARSSAPSSAPGRRPPATDGEDAALARFRSALEPDWTLPGRGGRRVHARRANERRDAAALDAIERLRYAEEHAVAARGRRACSAPPEGPGHRRRRARPLTTPALPRNPAPQTHSQLRRAEPSRARATRRAT